MSRRESDKYTSQLKPFLLYLQYNRSFPLVLCSTSVLVSQEPCERSIQFGVVFLTLLTRVNCTSRLRLSRLCKHAIATWSIKHGSLQLGHRLTIKYAYRSFSNPSIHLKYAINKASSFIVVVLLTYRVVSSLSILLIPGDIEIVVILVESNRMLCIKNTLSKEGCRAQRKVRTQDLSHES